MIRALMKIAFAIMLTAGVAAADEREDLMDDINESLEDIADELGDAADAGNDASDVRSIAGSLDDIIDFIEELEDYAEGDSEAESIVDDYPDYVDDFEDALGALAELKALQFELHPIPEFCEGLDSAFRNEVDDVLRNSQEYDDIASAGASFAREADQQVSHAEDVFSDAQGHAREATRFSESDGKWRDVSSALEDAAEDMLDHVEAGLAQTQDICGPLTDWEDLDYVQRAHQSLENIDMAIVDFLDDGEAWFARSRGWDDRTCRYLEVVRDAYCSFDWEIEEDAGSARSQYDKFADDAAREILNDIEQTISEYERDLRGRAQALSDQDPDARDLAVNMNKRYQGLKRLESGDDLKGARNPKTRAWILYGHQQHASMTSSEGCNVADKAIPGASGNTKPDCVLLKGCQIIEFKPDTPSGRAAGAKVENHVKALNAYLETRAARLSDAEIPASRDSKFNRFGDDFVLQAMAHSCVVEGDAKFTGDVKTYNPCTRESLSCPKLD